MNQETRGYRPPGIGKIQADIKIWLKWCVKGFEPNTFPIMIGSNSRDFVLLRYLYATIPALM